MVESGRIDINTEVSMLALHLALPKEGKLEVFLNIVSYLRVKHNSRLYLDPTYPEIDYASCNRHKWVDFYCKVKESIPLNIPESRVKDVDFKMYVDSDHARDKSPLRSRTGFLIYRSMDLLQWLSKKKTTI